ncbi:MAG: Kef-type K+ transport system membrane component KefB [Patescibacteria group bacterium]|jgi:Kef-type K+ transport system membrane component KefB
MVTENILISLLTILAITLIIPELLKNYKLPLISVIIISGTILGPHGLNYIQTNATMEFLGFLGMTFVMLMAGLETNLKLLNHSKVKISLLAIANGLIPFIVGFGITRYFGYALLPSLIIGIIAISSSVAIIIPTIATKKNMKPETHQTILASIILTDIASLIFLGIVLQNISPITFIPLPIYFLLLILSLPLIFYIIPKFSKYEMSHQFKNNEGKERRIRFILTIVLGIILYFTLLGVHPILAGFLAGLSLSTIIKKDVTHTLYNKIHTLGYGLFIPIFFFIVGMQLDISLFSKFDQTNMVIPVIILGVIIAKTLSGFIGGKLIRFTNKESLIFGVVSTTQLTTTLAVTYTTSSLGIIDSTLTSAIILLAIITTTLAPLFVSLIKLKKERKSKIKK